MKYLKRIRQKITRISNLIEIIYSNTESFKFELRKNFLENSLLNTNSLGINALPPPLPFNGIPQVIVSLTSYGKRIEEVWMTIESIMQQTRKADRIILWLGEDDLKKPLPASLLLQKERGLEIRGCKDLKSYKKLIQSLIDFPDSIIITVDDDVLYNNDLIDRLYRSYLKDPDAIHACRTHVMTFDKERKLKPYNEWKWWSSETDNRKLLFFTGVGGVLYPPHSLHPEVLNEKEFMKLSPYADDVWFNAMALLNGSKIVKVETKDKNGDDFITNEDVQDIGLKIKNTIEGNGNDVQISAVFTKYNLYDLLN